MGEWVAKNEWDKQEMYLHVEDDNIPAQKLYESIGYSVSDKELTPLGKKRENIEKISYYQKKL